MLNDSSPVIWRGLDVRSDLTLDVLHQVLQDAFDWTDSHLHRFTLSDDAWHIEAEQYLCPYDVTEADTLDDPGAGLAIAEELVRLDEVLVAPGDTLAYVYDYGDDWQLTLRLEDTLPFDGAQLADAVCIDAARAAPPEDSGSLRSGAELAEVLEDPAFVDIAEINAALARPWYTLRRRGVPLAVLATLAVTQAIDGDDVLARLAALPDDHGMPSPDDLAAALRPHLWFLDHVGSDGIPLTASGYLTSADCKSLGERLPTMAGWAGAGTREHLTPAIADFRHVMSRQLGLVRTLKGRLVLTKAGTTASGRPDALFAHMAERLRPSPGPTFSDAAEPLLLAYAAARGGSRLPLARVAELLTLRGWGTRDGGPVTVRALRGDQGATLRVLADVEGRQGLERDPRSSWSTPRISPVAAALAWSALVGADRVTGAARAVL